MLAVLLCLTPHAAAGEAPSWTPLLQLRWALKGPVLDSTQNSNDLQLRRKNVQEAIAGLSRLPDLREALLLQEWRDDDADAEVAAIDQAARLELTRRFEQALHGALREGDPASRIAAASMVSDMPVAIRCNGIRGWTFRDCTGDLADLVRGNDPAVQAAAAKALGAMNADSAVAVPALAELLKSENAVLRRAAAEGLSGLIGVTAQTIHRSNGAADPASRTQLLQVGRAIIPVIGGGLVDPDPQVRRSCIEAIQRTADALVRIVGDPPAGYNAFEVEAYRAEVSKQYAELSPLACDLKDQTAGLTNALSDPVAEVRLQAHHALEDMGRAWLRLEAGVGCAPAGPRPTDALTTSKPKDTNEKPLMDNAESKQPLLDRLHAALPAIATGVADPNVGARRAAIDALETLGAEASPAVPALVGALSDPDPFVRWSAIRVLGRMGPDEITKIVPGLIGALTDSDLDVRVAAARTLGQFGPAAQEAVPALTKAASAGDTDMRLAAIQALEGIGSDAQSSLPTLVASLQDADARVRQATARFIGKLGPAAKEQKEALKTALADRDPDVRKAAGDALLRILYASASPPPFVVGEATVPLEVPGNNTVAGQSPGTPALSGPDLLTVDWQDKLFAKSSDQAVPAPALESPANPASATGPVLTAPNDPGPTLPKEAAGESSPIVPASVWQATCVPLGPALVSQTRLTQASLLRPTSNVMVIPQSSAAPAAISPAIAQQAAVVVPVASNPPAAVLMPPIVVYTPPPPFRAPGPPPPGTVIARTDR
jgi:HEAT repeat protein